MNNGRPAIQWASVSVVFAGVFAAITLFTPHLSFAETVGIQTKQILPPQGNSCAALQVKAVQAYVYEGNLDSFDVAISDASYVAISGSVGERAIPFNHMTRRVNADGSLRVHVDIQSYNLSRAVPVQIVLLSAAPGAPVCFSTVAFEFQQLPNTVTDVVTPGHTTTSTSSAGSNSQSTGNGSASGMQGGEIATDTPNAGASSSVNAMANICASGGAAQLWFVLLALYVVIVAFAALWQPPLAHKHVAIPLAMILVPLLIFVAFWYFSALCRAGDWVPVLLLIISVGGLFLTFREARLQNAQVIQLPPAKKE